MKITEEEKKLAGNHRYNIGWALERFPNATHYTSTPHAGTSKGYSNQYQYFTWHFYAEE